MFFLSTYFHVHLKVGVFKFSRFLRQNVKKCRKNLKSYIIIEDILLK